VGTSLRWSTFMESITAWTVTMQDSYPARLEVLVMEYCLPWKFHCVGLDVTIQGLVRLRLSLSWL